MPRLKLSKPKAILIFTLVVILALVAVYHLFIKNIASYALRSPPSAGRLETLQMMHDGIERSYHIFKPNNMRAGAPLVVNFHGSLSTGKWMRDISGYDFDYLAVKHGFPVVYPDGYDRHWNDCRASASYRANIENIDDVGFFKALVSQIQRDENINPQEVIITGFSNGGHMVYRLALEAPETFLLAAPIAANLPVNSNMGCEKSGLPVNMLIFNGTNDPINPFDSGLVAVLGNKSRGEVISSAQTVSYWAGLANADNSRVTLMPEKDGNPKTYVMRDIRIGTKTVGLYALHGSGHVVPSQNMYFRSFLGGNAADINAAAQIYQFYRQIVAARKTAR